MQNTKAEKHAQRPREKLKIKTTKKGDTSLILHMQNNEKKLGEIKTKAVVPTFPFSP